MSCEKCTDENGYSIYPIYGVGPHKCFYKISGASVGESVLLCEDQWPNNYQEDPDCKGMGTHWCDKCGEGRPC